MKREFAKVVSLFLAIAFLFMVCLPSTTAQAATYASDLFISEYIEGGSYNKAIEIYNGTDDSVNLSAYSLELYSNGSATSTSSVTLSGSLASGDVYVICHGSADAAVKAVADLESGVVNFNGDDAFALLKGGAVIDAIGQIGIDPGSAWTGSGASTVDKTLVRKSSITQGDSDGSNAFDPSVEWDYYAKDEFGYLGSHTMDGFGGGANLPLSINHAAVTESYLNEDIVIEFTVQDDDTVTGATVYYKQATTASFTSLTAVDGGSSYSATIPAVDVTEDIEYYIEVTNDNSETAREPDSGVHTITVTAAPTVVTIAEARAESNGTEVAVQGIVTSTGYKTFIQDTSAGINLYNQTDATTYAVGDLVKVTGNMGEYNGLRQITGFTVEVVSSSNPLPVPQVVTIDQVSEDHEGERVLIQGVTIGAINTGGNTTLTDALLNTINIYKIPALIGINEGDLVDVVAIGSEYNTTYQLHVAAPEDVTLASTVDYISIADARAEADGTEVTIQAIVTSTGYKTFIQDTSAGINLYNQTDSTSFAMGDLVKITGNMGAYNGLRQITGYTVEVVSSGNPLPAPQVVTIDEVSEDHEGERVLIQGVTIGAINTGGNTTLTDALLNTINIYKIPALTGINEGDLVDVIAIGSEFNGTYQLHVVAAEDVTLASTIDYITIAEARAEANGTEVTVQAIVTSTGYKTFTQDTSAGINLYNQTDSTSFAMGDLVKITGNLGAYNGLRQITGYTVEVVSSGNPLPVPQVVTIDQVSEDHEGERVLIQGVTIGAINTGGNTTLTDALLNTINIYKIPTLNSINEGDLVDVVAIGSEFNGTYQLHVVAEGDVTPAATVDYITIAEARAEADGTEVTVQAFVTSTGYKTFIQDTSAGINLYNQSDSTSYAMGDLVKITGNMGVYNGLRQITGYTVEVVSSGNPLPVPQIVTIDQVSEDHEGERVLIKGVTIGAINTGGNTTLTDTLLNTINIYKIPTLNSINDGDLVDVVAIGSEYNGTYQLHVVAEGDVTPAATVDYITITEARAEADGTEVTVQGIVTHEESNTLIYMQDLTAGVKIDTYGTGVDLSSYHEGDIIKVIGLIDFYKDELEISVEDAGNITLVSSGNPLPTPAVITISQLGDYQGQLVEVKMCHITDTTSSDYSFSIEDDSGSTTLYHSKADSFDVNEYAVGEYYDIIGIAGKYTNEQLKLRYGTDMTEQEPPQDPNATLPIVYNLQPANMAVTFDKRPVISAQLEKTEADIDTTSIKLFINGVEVTPQVATVTDVSYTPSVDFALGEHDVTLEVADVNGQIKTVEWYFVIDEASSGGYNFYYGVPHSHTAYSDGKDTPTDAFAHARANGLDFLFVTDHSNWFDGVTDGDYEYNPTNDQYEEVVDSEWYDTRIEAETFNATYNDFLAMRGFEMTSGTWGHANVINSPNYVEAKKQMTGLDEFYAWLNKQPDSVGAFNHPNWPDDSFYDFAYVPEIDRMMCMIEVGNGAPPYSYTRSESHYFKALDNGWHVGAINGQDNHNANWGDSDNLTVVIANALTPEAFIEAMRNRRVYSTETRTLELTVKANGYWMGSIVDAEAGDTLSFDILAEDSAVPISQLQLITNGGTIIDTKNVGSSTSVSWTPQVMLTGGAQWFVVKVIHEDGRWGTGSPIFTPAAENDIKLTSLVVDPDTTLPGYETTIETTVTNMGIRDAADIEVNFYSNSISPANLIGTDTAAILRAGDGVILSTTWTPTEPGSVKIIAKLTEKPGVTTVTEMSTTAIVVAANGKTVMVDGTHNNYDVTGAMMNVMELLRRYGYTVIVNEVTPITAPMLTGVDVLIINTPKMGADDYTAAEDTVIGQWVQNGGSILVASTSNYNSKPNTSLNSMMEAIGTTIRFNNDNVYEPASSDKYSGGMVWSVYAYNLPDAPSGLNENMEAIRIFSGCSLVTESGGVFDALVNNPSTGLEILLGGNDTSYTALAEADTYIYNVEGELNGEDIPIIAKEEVGSGKVVAAGRHFYSDFEIVNDVSNTALTLKLIDYLAGVNRIRTIEDVRANANVGDIVTVKGTVTAPTDHFFDAMYIQDDTSGVCLYGTQGRDLPMHTEVIATGVVEEFEGELEIAFNKFDYDVLYVGPTDAVAVTPLSTHDAMQPEHTGMLVSTIGVITEYDEDNSYFKLNDGSGEAYIHVDGYVGADMGRFKAGDYLKVTGIASHGAAGPRIRVRFFDDMELLNLTSINIVEASETVSVNQTGELALESVLSDGTTITQTGYPGLTWSSSNTGVATVNENGVVTGVSLGSATITATANGKTDTCSITVNKVAVTSVTLSSTTMTITLGSTRTLVATVAPNNASYPDVTWASSNTGVATVDANGKVTAVGTGSSTITATADGKTATCAVTVKKATTPTDPPTEPEEEVEVVVPEAGITMTVSGGTATAEVDDEELEGAIDDAIDKMDEQGADRGTVTLPCGNAGGASELEVVIDAGLAQKAADNDVSIKVETDDVKMIIPPEVLDTSGLDAAEGSVMNVRIKEADDQAASAPKFEVENEQGEALGLAFEFEIAMVAPDGTETVITEFDEPVMITIQLTADDIEGVDNLDGLKIAWYNPDTGEVEIMESTYDPATMQITFTTTHFSIYMLVEMSAIDGDDNQQSPDTGDYRENVEEEEEPGAAAAVDLDNTSGGGIWPILMWILIGVGSLGILAAAGFIIAKRRRTDTI